ncbi:hypothetical protein WJX73_008300 [Symbiochloris irregularis]|uniref:Uncharacterized protein n=1 Tax=Symbiochloris irregularis TaxID=706552 RepID=A0AAW1NR54_9CHLO
MGIGTWLLSARKFDRSSSLDLQAKYSITPAQVQSFAKVMGPGDSNLGSLCGAQAAVSFQASYFVKPDKVKKQDQIAAAQDMEYGDWTLTGAEKDCYKQLRSAGKHEKYFQGLRDMACCQIDLPQTKGEGYVISLRAPTYLQMAYARLLAIYAIRLRIEQKADADHSLMTIALGMPPCTIM